MLYDTHCHPYLAKEKTQENILENFFYNSENRLNAISVDLESSKINIALAKKQSWVSAVIGIHPTHTLAYKNTLPEVIQELESLYQDNSEFILAIWETGLDYHWLSQLSETSGLDESEIIKIQKTFFQTHICLAKKYSLPLVIHNRSAKDDIFKILQEEDFKNFVFHCYSEDWSFAQKLISFAPDCVLGFGGVSTFKSATNVQETIKNIDLKHIVIETDSPYLTPSPLRGKEENEPLFSKYVLQKIQNLRSEKAEDIEREIYKNSIQFFWIKNID